MSNIPQTPEAIAYLLMEAIFRVEKKVLHVPDRSSGSASVAATKKDILDTYGECLKMVRHP